MNEESHPEPGQNLVDCLPEETRNWIRAQSGSIEMLLKEFLLAGLAPSCCGDLETLAFASSSEQISRISMEIANAATNSKDAELTAYLTRCFNQTERVEERELIGKTIGLIRAESGFKFLRQLLFNPDSRVRMMAIEASALYNDRSLFPLYRELFTGGAAQVKQAALDAIQHLQQFVQPTLVTVKLEATTDAILVREDITNPWSPFTPIPRNEEGTFGVRIQGILQDFMLQPALDEKRRYRKGGLIVHPGEHNIFSLREEDFATIEEMSGTPDYTVVRALETEEVSEVYNAMNELDDPMLIDISLHAPNYDVSTGALNILMARNRSMERVKELFRLPYSSRHREKILYEFMIELGRNSELHKNPDLQYGLRVLYDEEVQPELRSIIRNLIIDPEGKLRELVRAIETGERQDILQGAFDAREIMDGVMALEDTRIRSRIIASIETKGKFENILRDRDELFIREFFGLLAQQPSFIAIVKDYGVPKETQKIALEFMNKATLKRALDREEIDFEVRSQGGILLAGLECGEKFEDLDDVLERCDSIPVLKSVSFYCRSSEAEARATQIEAANARRAKEEEARREAERIRRLEEKERERQKREEEKRMRVLHEQEVISARQQRGQCIHCGEPMSWLQRLTGKRQHNGCRQFRE